MRRRDALKTIPAAMAAIGAAIAGTTSPVEGAPPMETTGVTQLKNKPSVTPFGLLPPVGVIVPPEGVTFTYMREPQTLAELRDVPRQLVKKWVDHPTKYAFDLFTEFVGIPFVDPGRDEQHRSISQHILGARDDFSLALWLHNRLNWVRIHVRDTTSNESTLLTAMLTYLSGPLSDDAKRKPKLFTAPVISHVPLTTEPVAEGECMWTSYVLFHTLEELQAKGFPNAKLWTAADVT